MPSSPTKAHFWGYRFLLAIELLVVVLLVMGGCYSKQNYTVLSPQAGDERLNKCDVVVEGRVVNVVQDKLRSWHQRVFCYPLSSEEPSGPDRYNVSIDVDKVLKGVPDMPRRLQVDNCRPPTAGESRFFAQGRFRIGYNQRHGNSYRNLIVVPLPDRSTTRPTTQLIPSAPAAH